jgi:hypothetical protein
MSRVLQDILVMFQWLPLTSGSSARHGRDMARKSHPYTQEQWARPSPVFCAAHNRLRRARGELPIPEPKVDLYVPPQAKSTPLPFNPADPEAVAAECEFHGLGDQTWEKIAKRLALELARDQLTDRQLHTEVLHRAVAQFVALAMKESGWHRKKIIGEAMDRYGVGERTVEKAIANYPKEFYFTDGDKLSPAAAFRGLPIELRLLALGLPPPR